MMRIILSLILAALIAAPTPTNAAARKRRARGPVPARVAKGTIIGHVVDAKGHPLSRARLHVHRLRRPGVHPRLRAGGIFGTRALAPGLYIVNAASRAAGRGKSVATVIAGKATSVTVRVHKRLGHHSHQKHSLGTSGKSIVKHANPAPKQPVSTPRPAVVPNRVR